MASRAKKTATTVTVTGSNMPTFWNIATIKNVANSGFDDKNKADLMNGTAVQRVAAAVYALWLDWRNNGHPDKENVSDLQCAILTDDTSKANARTLKTQLAAVLIGPAIDTENMAADDVAQIKTNRSNRMALLGRAMIPAAIVKADGLTLDAFNQQAGCFAVKGSLLCERDVTPMGAISTDKPILLNNRPISGERKSNGALWRKRASIDQLVAAYRDRQGQKATRGTRNGGKVDWSKLDGDKLASVDTLTTDVLIAALHKRFVRPKGAPVHAYSDLLPASWNNLSDIAQESDAAQTTDTFKASAKLGVSENSTVASNDKVAA